MAPKRRLFGVLPPDLPVTTAATFCATVVDEWVRCGVTDAVVCPGSRSTPMALALAADDRVRVHVHHDERAGAFVALGLGVATGRPAVVLTTSGTAAVELHPAVVEARYGRVPLLVCTADRPPELRDVGAPQAIDQTRLYGASVRWAWDPGVPDAAAAPAWRSMACRAVLAATSSPPGPVHVQLPFRDPLVGAAGPLPAGRPGGAPWHQRPAGRRTLDRDGVDALAARLAVRRGVIVAGGGIDDPEPVLALARTLAWPVVADPRSGCRQPDPVVVAHADAILRSALAPALAPEVVLRLGTPPASKVLGQWAAGATSAVQVVVDADGEWADPERVADVVVAADPSATATALGDALTRAKVPPAAEPAWLARWRSADDASATAVAEVLAGQATLTEPAIARAALAGAPDGATVVVSSSMPVRDVEWYGAPRTGVRVRANRGANGIDGVVSTAVGVALAVGPVVALVGDVAFLHDTNALLGLAGRPLDLVVIVVDNDGGGIFSFLPQADQLAGEPFEQLFGTPHGVDVTALARAHGVPATVVADGDELAAALQSGLAAGGAHVVVVRTDRAANVAVHRAIHDRVAEALAG